MRSYFTVSILPGMAFSRFDRITCRWKSPNQPLVICIALKVSGCGRFRPENAVENQQPQEHKETADAIDGPPAESTD
jgi:hypothetical protein